MKVCILEFREQHSLKLLTTFKNIDASRNVKWSEEGVTNWVYSSAQDLVNLSSFRSEYFDERTEKMNENFF